MADIGRLNLYWVSVLLLSLFQQKSVDCMI